MDSKWQSNSTGRAQIQRTALVPALPPPTQFTASWTGNHSTGWFGDQHKAPILLDNDQHDLPRIRSATHELPTAAHLVCHPSVIHRQPEDPRHDHHQNRYWWRIRRLGSYGFR
jgi:hypothetical protein